MRAAGAAVCICVAAAGCVPWAVGETAETLPGGRFEVAMGASALALPTALDSPFLVPQVRASVGVIDGLDVALAYVPPATGLVRAKIRVHEGRRLTWAFTLGGGLHVIPDVVDQEVTVRTPLATAGVLGSIGEGRYRPYGAIRVIAPFHTRGDFATTAWLAPQLGLDLGGGRWRWGPELGAAIPVTEPRWTSLVLAVGARWRPSLP